MGRDLNATILTILSCILVLCNPLSLSAKSMITGTVRFSDTKLPVENVNVKIPNSTFKTKTGKNGQFKLPFAAGNFTVVFEGNGLFPKAVPLSVTDKSDYQMGEVSISKLPIIMDMYNNPIEGVEVTVKQAGSDSKAAVLSKAVSNSKGQVLINYLAGDLQITAAKAGYKTRSNVLNFAQTQEVSKNLWFMTPEKNGLYYNKNSINKSDFNFSKKQMSGMMIPAYYDGSYSVSSEPQILECKDSLIFYWIPENSATLGENPFAAKGGAYLYKVDADGKFVVYNTGRGNGEKVELYKTTQLCNEVDKTYSAMVQQKVQAYQIILKLPAGQFVMFQGGGNSGDNESHPDKKFGCWHFKVVDK